MLVQVKRRCNGGVRKGVEGNAYPDGMLSIKKAARGDIEKPGKITWEMTRATRTQESDLGVDGGRTQSGEGGATNKKKGGKGKGGRSVLKSIAHT